MIQPERKPSFEYTIKAIETRFKDFIFRSRLEAKWAAMFELMGWEWDYEPCDFNGWIPDFAIYGKHTVYVEVKPVIEFPNDVAKEMANSKCTDHMLIVGQKCLNISEGESHFGWLIVDFVGINGIEFMWDAMKLGRWTIGKGKIGFSCSWYEWTDVIADNCGGFLEATPNEIKRLWANAHNATRWMKTR